MSENYGIDFQISLRSRLIIDHQTHRLIQAYFLHIYQRLFILNSLQNFQGFYKPPMDAEMARHDYRYSNKVLILIKLVSQQWK